MSVREEKRKNTYSKWWCAVMSTYVFIRNYYSQMTKKRKEKERERWRETTRIVTSFVLLIHAKNVKYQETHSFFFFTFFSEYSLLLHRNVDDKRRGDAIVYIEKYELPSNKYTDSLSAKSKHANYYNLKFLEINRQRSSSRQ